VNNSPIFDRISKTLSEKRQASLFRTLAEPDASFDIDMSTNSYLWLHANAEVAKAAKEFLKNQFHGNCASRLISSNSSLFAELEAEIAAWKRAESALVFNTGYAANLGIIQAICKRDTEVFSDKLNHASIIDGIRLSKAKVACFRHRDMADLKDVLKASGTSEKLIITESVFSVDGDCAPLADICELARRFNCMVMVDDAHATGIFGKNGSGLVEELGLEESVDIRMGTLSKSLAGMGGFFAGSAMLKDFFVNSCRSLMYSTALPHAALAWDLAAIRHIRKNPEMGRKLLVKADRFREALNEAGFDTLSSETQIIPCVLGDEKSALSLAAHLRKKGIKAPAIRPPTVPAGSSRVRFNVHLGLTDEDLKRVATALKSWKADNSASRAKKEG
jgi:8-amino-7-oxononanoate synthase